MTCVLMVFDICYINYFNGDFTTNAHHSTVLHTLRTFGNDGNAYPFEFDVIWSITRGNELVLSPPI